MKRKRLLTGIAFLLAFSGLLQGCGGESTLSSKPQEIESTAEKESKTEDTKAPAAESSLETSLDDTNSSEPNYEIEQYSDILKHPSSFKDIFEPMQIQPSSCDCSPYTEYFVADINSDGKKELVLLLNMGGYRKIAVVNADGKIFHSPEINDSYGNGYGGGVVVYDKGIVAIYDNNFSLDRKGNVCYLNTTTGEAFYTSISGDTTHLKSSMDSSVDLTGDALLNKEIELESGNALYPKPMQHSLEDFGDKEITVVSDNREISYKTYQEAYRAVIQSVHESVHNENQTNPDTDTSFCLFYLDDDDIPELWIEMDNAGTSEFGERSFIYTFQSSKIAQVYDVTGDDLSAQLLEKQGIMCLTYRNSDSDNEVFFQYHDGRITELAKHSLEAMGDDHHTLNGKPTTEESYNQEVQKYKESAKDIEPCYSYDEILRVLNGENVELEKKPEQVETPEPTGKTATIRAKSGLNLRTGPGTDSSKILLIPNGAVVEVLEENGDWTKVKYGSNTGWVNSAWIA